MLSSSACSFCSSCSSSSSFSFSCGDEEKSQALVLAIKEGRTEAGLSSSRGGSSSSLLEVENHPLVVLVPNPSNVVDSFVASSFFSVATGVEEVVDDRSHDMVVVVGGGVTLGLDSPASLFSSSLSSLLSGLC